MKHIKLTCTILSAALAFSLCGCAGSSSPGTSETQPSATVSETVSPQVPQYWEPELEVERSDSGSAVIVFQQAENPEGCLVLSGNEYSLEVFTPEGWDPLPRSQEHVNWVEDAFVVTAVPRDDIDWQWLYGTLPAGHYRICKPVSLLQNDRILARSTVYAEFTLEETGPAPGGTYDISRYLPDISSFTYVPLNTLDSSYSYDQAVQDHVVVLVDGSACANREVWLAFDAATLSGQTARVRCMSMGTDNTFPFLYDIHFDGLQYNMHWYEGGTEKSLSFKHMVHFQGGDHRDPYPLHRYVLVTENNVTWEDIQWGAVNQSDVDDIAHRVVYQELGYNPASPPIPESMSVTLSLRGDVAAVATGAQAVQLSQLFREAQLLTHRPDILYTGMDLSFQGSDGTRITLWLDNNGGIFLYNGYYYSYPTDTLLHLMELERFP